jgi:hypothetical protein
MGSIRIKTDSGIRMDAKLDTKTDYDKIIKFLQAERDSMSSKPKKSFKDELVTDISTGYYEAQRRAK